MHSGYKFSTIVSFIWQDAAKEEKIHFPISLIIFVRKKRFLYSLFLSLSFFSHYSISDD